MNRYRSIVPLSQMESADIIQFQTQNAVARRQNPYSYGYVHNIVYDGKNGDIVGLDVLPVLSVEQAQLEGANNQRINEQEIDNDLGLSPNVDWAIVLSVIRLRAQDLGRNETVQRIGKTNNTRLRTIIENAIEGHGEERMYYGGKGYKQSTPWGLYFPIGVTRPYDDNEAQPASTPKTGRPKKSKNGPVGKVIDIDLQDAVRVFGLNPDVAKAFMNPDNKKTKPFSRFRELFNMVTKSPEDMDKYIQPEATDLSHIPLSGYKNIEFPTTFVESLANPDKASDLKKVTNLQEALELVTQRPEEIEAYPYLNIPTIPEFIIKAIKEFADEARPQVSNSYAKDIAISAIKDTWKKFTAAYVESAQGGEIPEEYKKDGKPVWKFVPKVD